MDYLIRVWEEKPSIEQIKFLRGITKLPINEIKSGLIGEGVSIISDYRSVLEIQEYNEWVYSTIKLFKTASNLFSKSKIFVGDEVERMEYFENFITSSIASFYQEHD